MNEVDPEAIRLWDAGELGAAENRQLRVLLDARGLVRPQSCLVGAKDDDVKIASLADIPWNYDPAASCPRRRAFVDVGDRRFLLGAYEDGDWWVDEGADTIASGKVPGFQRRGWVRDKSQRWPLVGPLQRAKLAALEALLASLKTGVPLEDEEDAFDDLVDAALLLVDAFDTGCGDVRGGMSNVLLNLVTQSSLAQDDKDDVLVFLERMVALAKAREQTRR